MTAWKVLFDEIQELPADICCNVVIERWIEPNDVSSSVFTSPVVVLLGCVLEFMVVPGSFQGVFVIRDSCFEYIFI